MHRVKKASADGFGDGKMHRCRRHRYQRYELIVCQLVIGIFVSLGAVYAQDIGDAKQSHDPAQGGSKHIRGKYDVSHIGSRGIGGGINLYSIEREQELGRQLSAEAESQMTFLRDRVITDYVNRLSQHLVSHSDANIPFKVKVIDNDEVNAFTLPGGFLYVNRGLLVACESEAELAGVLAHEISHVAARHATKTLTRRELFNLATIPLLFAGGGAATAVTYGMGLATPISFMKFSRNAEREADLLGLEYTYAAGYDPTEFIHFLERMQQTEKKGKKTDVFMKLFATHPVTNDRIRRAQDEIANRLPAKDEYVITSSEFDQIRTRLLNSPTRKGQRSDSPTLRRRDPN